jgi:hypothetical protein
MARKASRKHLYSCALCKQLASGQFASHIRPGKQAVRGRDGESIEGNFDCSFSIGDLAKGIQQHGEKVFDYALVARKDCGLHLIEIHEASSTSNVDYLIAEKTGTTAVLARRGLDLKSAKWHWVLTAHSSPAFNSRDKYGKRLVDAGINQPVRQVRN